MKFLSLSDNKKLNLNKCNKLTNVDTKTSSVKAKIIVVLVVDCLEKETNNLNIKKHAKNARINIMDYVAKT
jgi:hypothetical protein